MTHAGELRRHWRSTQSASASIVWSDRGGGDKFVNGRTVNVSESGLRIEVSEPIEKQTYVTVQCLALGLHGRASVRSCARKGTKYLLGLEFSAGLRWRSQP
jgi:hypothetical protein